MNITKLTTPDATVKVRPNPRFNDEGSDWRTLNAMLPYWQNNSETYSGFLRWVWDFYSVDASQYVKESSKIVIRDYHIPDWWATGLKMMLRYYPGMRKFERANAIATYRDGSKTSLIQLLVSYFWNVGKYGIYWEDNLLPPAKFVRYRAKTFREAVRKVETIKNLLADPDIIKVFGDKMPSFTDKAKGISKNNMFILITKDKNILIPYGIEQSARGMNILGRRPELDIDDDVEDTSNTKTVTAREYNWQEIMAEQFGGLKDDGLTIFIFNYVHPQGVGATIVEAAKKKQITTWNVAVRKIAYEKYDEAGNKIIIPDWPERFDVSYIQNLENFYKIKQNDYALYRREYYNEFVAEEEYILREYRGSYFREEGLNWLKIKAETGEEKIEAHKVYISVDPAISEDKRSSDSVIAVVMVSPEGIRRIHDMRIGKFDIRDRFTDESKRPFLLARSPDEMANIKRKGLVDETVRLILQYNADLFIYERAGQQIAWFNETLDLLKRLGFAPRGTTYHPTDEKIYKIKSGLLSKFAAGLYEINENLYYKNRIISALKSFPNELDIFDALHNVEPFLVAPKKVEFTGKKESKNKESLLPPALQNPEKYIGQVETFLLI